MAWMEKKPMKTLPPDSVLEENRRGDVDPVSELASDELKAPVTKEGTSFNPNWKDKGERFDDSVLETRDKK